MDRHWALRYLPKAFCAISYVVNPVLVCLIFSEKSRALGNYRFLLLYFAVFNLVYSASNVIVPLDIHSYRYCFFVILSDGWFAEISNLNTHLMIARCSLIASSYAVLLSHFIYRYLVIRNSSLTKGKFHLFILGSLVLLCSTFALWHTVCYCLANANTEIREYVREDFWNIYKQDSMNFNMMAALYHEGSESTVLRSWAAISLWSLIDTLPIVLFIFLGRLISEKLKLTAATMSTKTSKLQIELLRALAVQTIIPIFVSFLPAALCWYTPMFGIQLGRSFNYFEVTAFGLFAFVDPIAIILCIPVFRRRLFCRVTQVEQTVPSSSIPF